MAKKKRLLRIVTAALALVMMFSTVITVHLSASGTTYYGSSPSINQLTNKIEMGTESLYNESVMYKLPDTIKEYDDISIIIQTTAKTLLDAYDASKSTLTFGDYTLTDEASDVRYAILAESDRVKNKLQGISYTEGERYDTLFSGFEITIKASDFEAVCKAVGKDGNVYVGEVYNAAKTELVENNVNVYGTGIFSSEDFKNKYGIDGTGMVVAVLDTGIDYYHSAFADSTFLADRSKLGLTFDKVKDLINNNSFKAESLAPGLTPEDVYISDKIPYGFDYADDDSDVFPLLSNHGTHVSGVIVGNHLDHIESEDYSGAFEGVAPNAQVVAMKIFSDVEATSHTSWILAALEDCVTLGVDVINMSIGTTAGFSTQYTKNFENDVYDRIRDRGISLIVAASNSFNSSYSSDKNGNLPLTSNPDSATVGSPSTFVGALSVASIEGAKTPYLLFGDNIMYFNESTDRVSKEKDFVGELLGEGVTELELEYVLVAGAGRTAADYTGIDVKGKIALIKRGYNTFEEKAALAQEMGAIGVIVYNNVSGDIKMNVGEVDIAVCSISQEHGELLAASGKGKIKISTSQMSGPFMSDFSSWGPTPDLKIKPEITAHGGAILSAVPGEDYDRISGTSMATPNISGVAALLREYVEAKFNLNGDNVAEAKEINAIVNRLMMSTADIINNKNGLPYSVRKQGAGLANLNDSAATNAYILTYNEDGSVMDKSKIELGDDPSKTGVYTLKFGIYNFGSSAMTYAMGYYVLTEGVSDIKTSHGETTVTETAYSLSGAIASIDGVSGGTLSDDKKCITVPAGATVNVTVTITLSDVDKKYLDDSFENGGYVEGFLTLAADCDDRAQDLNVPYLAFYGDWTQAPLFDLDYFETNKDELDDSIDPLDKNLPDAYATRPVGGSSGDYIGFLGSYYFEQKPGDKIIAADRKYIAISNQNQYGEVNSLRFVWAGMLRGAERIEITITDAVTGEVVYSATERYIRKSYGDGGPISPANVQIEFSAIDNNLKNNTQYNVTLKGYLDYGDGGESTNLNNEFSFPLTTDFTAPMLTDCEFYTEYDRSTKKTRLFAKMAISDNHYAMAFRAGYLQTDSTGGDVFYSFDKYAIPIYSEYNSTSYVVYELTDYLDTIAATSTNNSFTISCYDYAMNLSTFEIQLPDDFQTFGFEDGEGGITTELSITLSPNEVYTINPVVYPSTEWAQLLTYTSNNKKSVDVVNGKIIAKGGTGAVITAKTPDGKTATIKVKVLSEDDDDYKKYDKPVADSFTLTGFFVNKAFYKLDNTDRDIGTTGETVNFASSSYYNLSLYPSESVTLFYELHAYFPESTQIVFESGNEKVVKIDASGTITGVAEGLASVTAKVLMDGKSTLYAATVNIEVKEPYVTSGPSLVNYFGAGDEKFHVDLSLSGLAITEIGQFAFSNYDYVDKGPNDEISIEAPETMKMWYIGDNTIKKVTVSEGVERIGPYAFANMTALEEIVLPESLETIDYGAFYGCTSLKKIVGIENVKFINQAAFQGCAITGALNLNNAVAIANYAFSENPAITSVNLPATIQSIGAYAFGNNTKLKSVTIKAEKVKLGQYAFTDCTALESVNINASVIPAGTFNRCTSLKSVTLGADVSVIGEYAFRGAPLDKFNVASGNSYFVSVDGGKYLTNKEGTEILLVAPALTSFTLTDAKITSVGSAAFSGCEKLTKASLPGVTKIGDYAFSECVKLSDVSFGALTEIGANAFENSALKSFNITKDLKLGDYAFYGSALTSVTIPSGESRDELFTVPEGCFANCAKLTTVVIGDNVRIGENAFYNNQSHSEHYRVIRNYYGVGEQERAIYYVVMDGPITSLTIGNNAVIEGGAFYGAANLTAITLGEGAKIGSYAFYNCASLVDIDLSKVISIGESAFSGDIHYEYTAADYSSIDITPEGTYTFRYYAPDFTHVDLSSLEKIGTNAFALCKELKSVTLGNKLNVIDEGAFRLCDNLTTVNLENVSIVGEYAFAECDLTDVDLSKAISVGAYAFCYNDSITSVILGTDGVSIEEGAFSYCTKLANLSGEEKARFIGEYAFAYTSLLGVDLSSAEYIGTHAFYMENLTVFEVKITSTLKDIGDNPFANCVVAPLSSTVEETFNGQVMNVKTVYTFNLSDKIKIIDGSIYRVVPKGLVLISWMGDTTANVAENTVRIGDMAFLGSSVKKVILPYTVASIGHKAFFDCNDLQFISFTSYQAPILEEVYDAAYYESMENIPSVGDYVYNDTYNGPITYTGIGVIPYYMKYVATLPANFFYGANFVDYVGHVEDKIAMIRPVNGKCYDSFVMSQYFSVSVDGAAAADEITLTAIAAMSKIPADASTITLEHKALVTAARAAYDKITSDEQRALVPTSLLSALKAAEQMIEDLEFLANGSKPSETPTEEKDDVLRLLKIVIVIVIILALCIIGLVIFLIFFIRAIKKGDYLPKNSAADSADANGGYDSSDSDEHDEDEAKPETSEEEEEAEVPDVPFEKIIYDKPVDFDDITEGYVDKEANARNRKIKMIVTASVAGVLLIGAIVLAVVGAGKSAFDDREKEGYTVSITFDSNGGTFKGSDSSIIDLYRPEDIGEDGLMILAPDDQRRDKTNVMTVTKADHFLAGWYRYRSLVDENDPSKGYTYSGKWDFENDRLTIDPNGDYSAEESVLTLYAAWVPYYVFEIYADDDRTTPILSVSALNLTIPEWHEGDVTLAMDNFPVREGYTLKEVFRFDNDQKLEGSCTGEWDELTATSKTPVIKLYTTWEEGKRYKIYSAEDLAANADVNGYYELYSNLNFKNVTWPAAFLNGEFNGKIIGNGRKISGVTIESTSRSRLANGLFSSFGENASIENVKFENITHVIDLMAVAQDATFGLLAGNASSGATFKNVSISGKLVFGDNCAVLAGSDSLTIKKVIGNGSVNGITSGTILVEKKNADNKAFDLSEDSEGTVTIVPGT